jgi:hypothetical protein
MYVDSIYGYVIEKIIQNTKYKIQVKFLLILGVQPSTNVVMMNECCD